MSEYTVQLRWIVENGYDLGLTNYPIFDENYRVQLNNKIIKHFYFREIGFETVALFADRLRTKLDEIMPYYNQLYKSAQLEFNPLYTHAFDKTITNIRTGESSSSGNNDTKGVYSDTPQGLLSIGDIDNELYASNASIGNSTSDVSGTSKQNETITEHSSGNTSGKSESELLLEFRKTFLNIDMQVITELETLFMGIWEV